LAVIDRNKLSGSASDMMLFNDLIRDLVLVYVHFKGESIFGAMWKMVLYWRT
jgi:hypothetical protein